MFEGKLFSMRQNRVRKNPHDSANVNKISQLDSICQFENVETCIFPESTREIRGWRLNWQVADDLAIGYPVPRVLRLTHDERDVVTSRKTLPDRSLGESSFARFDRNARKFAIMTSLIPREAAGFCKSSHREERFRLRSSWRWSEPGKSRSNIFFFRVEIDVSPIPSAATIAREMT